MISKVGWMVVLFTSLGLARTAYAQEADMLPVEPIAQPVVEQQAEPEIKTIGSLPDDYSSIMFYEEEKKRIQEVIEAIKNNKPIESLKPNDEPQRPQGPTIVATNYYYPQFYLGSIVYRNPDDWVIWVNSQKITAQKSKVIPGLDVDAVGKDKAIFTFDYTGDTNIQPIAESADPRILIDQSNQTVQFTIEPNQTFSTYSWYIFEGRVTPARMVLEKQTGGDAPIELPGINDILGDEEAEEPTEIKKAPKVRNLGNIMQDYEKLGDMF